MTPINAIDHDPYMSDFYNDSDVTNMRANYQKLLYFVYKVAMKYKHGRRLYKRAENGYNALNLVDKEEVQPHRELNAQLFVNALLWYVFEESGMGRPMLATVATLLYMCALRFFWVYALFPLCPNFTFLYLVWPVGWVLSLCTLLLFLFPTAKRLAAKYEAEEKATEAASV